MNFSLIIPTYKRKHSLDKALSSVWKNILHPNEIIIIDDDALDEDFLKKWKDRFKMIGVIFRYCKKDHSIYERGLSESKNLAIDMAECEIIFYIDDDVVLEKDYFEEMMKIWRKKKTNNKLFAVGGRIINNRKQLWFEKKVFNKLFGLSGDLSWDVNDVGFQVWDESAQSVQKAFYIHGGVSSYKKDLLKQFKFATFSGGRTGLEDVELALRVKQKGFYFIYNPGARLIHYHEQSGREHACESGKKESVNRKEIFKLHCNQNIYHKIWFIWANVGWILRKIIVLQWRYAYGMIVGLLKVT